MKVRQSSEIILSLNKDMLCCKQIKRRNNAVFRVVCLNRHQQRYLASSSHQSSSSSSDVAVAAKEDLSVTTKAAPMNVTSQIKTVASLFANLVRSTAPSFQDSLSTFAKNAANAALFTSASETTNGKNSIIKSEELNSNATEKKTTSYFPLYFDLMGRSSLNKVKTEAPPAVPHWKLKRKAITQESIDGRTKHCVSAVAKAVTQPSLLVRLEDFCKHLFNYPQAKSLAARQGAVSVLLRLKHSIPQYDEPIQRQIREGLSLLGYAEPLPAKGIRILSIDGGGTRGLLALRILRHLEEKVGRPIHESFDYVCGVSTGAVLALLIGASRKSLDEIEALYREISTDVFRQDRSSGLGGLLWSHSYYDTARWEKILQDQVGETTMIRTAREPNCLKVSAISSIVNREVLQPFVFRNYTLPFRIQSLYNGTFKHKMWEAARASSAAPGYFGEFKLGENIHQDGGLFVNNPCAVAIHEAKCIWPNAKLLSVVSIGTGRCQPLDLASSSLSTAAESTATSWKQKLSKVIDSATDTERVHTVLHDLLPPKVYYRFNPYLSELHGLDETDPVRWQRMLDDVEMYIRKNQSKMNEAANTLSVPRSAYQSLQNWITERRFLMQNESN